MAKRKFPRKMRKGPAAVIAALLIAAVGLLRSGCLEEPGSLPAGSQVQPVEGLLEVTFLDVGQGDSILLRTQEQNILIDAGEVEYGQTVVDDLADYGVEELDLVIATHMHSDHMGGMAAVVEALPVDTFVMTALPDSMVPTTRVYENLLTALEESPETAVEAAEPGVVYDLGGGVTLTILGPLTDYDDLNLTSVVCRVDAGARSFLFTGDMEREAEQDLLEAGADLDADVLKVGHHGASTSSTEDFLAAVSPAASVIEVGTGNSYGHPTGQTLERLQSYGPIYRTDLDGAVVVATDGVSLTVTTENGTSEVLM